MTDADGYQTAVLICYETSKSDTCHSHYVATCTEHFISDMEALAVDQDGDDCSVVILFHNIKGYDAMFLLQYMYKCNREVVNLVTAGIKVLSFTSDRLTFKDSLCFLPCPLSTFPATFGIKELTKGYFPHLFNTAENQSYEGPIPETRFYDPDGMSCNLKQEFLQWHATRVTEDYVFNLRRDMETYCISDIKLIKAECEKFEEEFADEAEFNPLVKCVTIASACNRYWRKKHVIYHTVALQPVNGWKSSQTNQSTKARLWLKWCNRQFEGGEPIRHVDNGGEARLSGMLVDGYDTNTSMVYEFNGCFYHGCPRYFPKQRHEVSARRGDRSFEECYEATKAKESKLEGLGYRVQVQWECDWDRKVKKDPALAQFVIQPVRHVEPTPTTRCLFWRENECGTTPPPCRQTSRDDSFPGRNIPLPLGKQVRSLSHGTSHHSHRHSTRGHFAVFWSLQSDRHPTARTVSPRVALSLRWQIGVSVEQDVHGNRNGQAPMGTTSHLLP